MLGYARLISNNSETNNMTNPFKSTEVARFIADRVEALAHRKTQNEIAAEAGFPNANFISILKSGKSKLPLDRVPSLAKALEVDPAYLMRISLEQSVGVTAAKAITEIFGSPVTASERAWLDELRDASGNSDPRITARGRTTLRGIFGK
ncbi:helix-turn-helix domain-containing protein [Rhodobacter lacus]|uniref:helix-turn-helix domain-containing protein n=1 Tax=Rhodobacter lacus TaxID=1641972 RepID=UPI0036713245